MRREQDRRSRGGRGWREGAEGRSKGERAWAQCGWRVGSVGRGCVPGGSRLAPLSLPTPGERKDADPEREGRWAGLGACRQGWGAWTAEGVSTEAEWPPGSRAPGGRPREEGRGSSQGGPPEHRKGLGAGESRRLGGRPCSPPTSTRNSPVGRVGEGGLLGTGPPLSWRGQPGEFCCPCSGDQPSWLELRS